MIEIVKMLLIIKNKVIRLIKGNVRFMPIVITVSIKNNRSLFAMIMLINVTLKKFAYTITVN